MVSLADSGALTFFAALEPSKLEKALKLTMQELERIATQAPRPGELRKAQDYTIGQTLMGLESTSNQMTWMGESLLSFGKVIDPLEVEKSLLAVTAEEVRAVAEFCLQRARLGVAVVGPAPDAEKIATWLGQ